MRLEQGSRVRIGNVQALLYWGKRPIEYTDPAGNNAYGAKVIKDLDRAVEGKYGSILASQGDFLLTQCRCLASTLTGGRSGSLPLDRNIFPDHTIPLGANPLLPFYEIEKRADGTYVGRRYISCPDDTDVDLSNFFCCFLSYEDFLVDWEKPTSPCCHSNANVTRHGWIEYTKRVFSLWRNLIIFSAKYKCDNCPNNGGKHKTFTSHDPHMLQQLPKWFREGLPFRVTAAGTYVDKETLYLVESVGHILGPSALQQLSDEVIARRFNNEELVRFSYHNEVTWKKTIWITINS